MQRVESVYNLPESLRTVYESLWPGSDWMTVAFSNWPPPKSIDINPPKVITNTTIAKKNMSLYDSGVNSGSFGVI
jgi:hypothetical protein